MLINHNYVGFTKLSCITSEIGICLSKCFCRIQIEFVRSLPFFFFLTTTTSAGLQQAWANRACSCHVPIGYFCRSKSHGKLPHHINATHIYLHLTSYKMNPFHYSITYDSVIDDHLQLKIWNSLPKNKEYLICTC